MRHRTSNYARVMLTSYGPKAWDVGDAYGEAWMDKAIRIGRTVKGIAETARTLTPEQLVASQTPQTEDNSDDKKGLVYLAWGLGITVAGFATYAFIKARGNK